MSFNKTFIIFLSLFNCYILPSQCPNTQSKLITQLLPMLLIMTTLSDTTTDAICMPIDGKCRKLTDREQSQVSWTDEWNGMIANQWPHDCTFRREDTRTPFFTLKSNYYHCPRSNDPSSSYEAPDEVQQELFRRSMEQQIKDLSDRIKKLESNQKKSELNQKTCYCPCLPTSKNQKLDLNKKGFTDRTRYSSTNATQRNRKK